MTKKLRKISLYETLPDAKKEQLDEVTDHLFCAEMYASVGKTYHSPKKKGGEEPNATARDGFERTQREIMLAKDKLREVFYK